MMYFTSDDHFGHEGVISYCKRPFQTVAEMDEALVTNWNKTVHHDSDTVYVLGDLAFHKYPDALPLVKRLRGQKHLIQGNHDKYSLSQYAKLGFLTVQYECVLDLVGHRVRLSHYPYRPTEEELKAMEGEAKPYRLFADKRPPRDGNEWLLHGHCHTAWKKRGRQINVGVDVWDYAPVSLRALESLMSKEYRDL